MAKFKWTDFTSGMPRILICFAPFCLDAIVAEAGTFLTGVVPVGFSS